MISRPPKLSSGFDLEQVSEKLAARKAARIESSKRAAVAALIRDEGGGVEVLLMRRPVHPGDRWSGQVCLPGGKEEDSDADSQATARRETWEELGIELEHCSDYVGALDDVQAIAQGKLLSTVISPHVYRQTQAPTVVLGAEAAHAFWLPLDRAARGELDSEMPYQSGGGRLLLPCWRYEGEVVWGLTYKMLVALLALSHSD